MSKMSEKVVYFGNNKKKNVKFHNFGLWVGKNIFTSNKLIFYIKLSMYKQ